MYSTITKSVSIAGLSPKLHRSLGNSFTLGIGHTTSAERSQASRIPLNSRAFSGAASCSHSQGGANDRGPAAMPATPYCAYRRARRSGILAGLDNLRAAKAASRARSRVYVSRSEAELMLSQHTLSTSLHAAALPPTTSIVQ